MSDSFEKLVTCADAFNCVHGQQTLSKPPPGYAQPTPTRSAPSVAAPAGPAGVVGACGATYLAMLPPLPQTMSPTRGCSPWTSTPPASTRCNYYILSVGSGALWTGCRIILRR